MGEYKKHLKSMLRAYPHKHCGGRCGKVPFRGVVGDMIITQHERLHKHASWLDLVMLRGVQNISVPSFVSISELLLLTSHGVLLLSCPGALVMLICRSHRP